MAFDKYHDTLVSLFADRAAASGPHTAVQIAAGSRPDALRNERPSSMPTAEPHPEGFEPVTWDELAADARRAAAALLRLGVRPGDRVAQVSGNRYLWIVIDLAVHLARGVHVALHHALAVEQQAWQIADCGATLMLGADDAALFANEPRATQARQSLAAHVVTDSELAALAASEPLEIAEAIARDAAQYVKRADLATILYTSGTTGEPKGVMLTHGNLTFNAIASLEAFPVYHEDRRLIWLPLSHIYARTSDLYTWIARGCEMGLARSRDTLMADIAVLRPTVINGVPYFYDKVRRHLLAAGYADHPAALQAALGGRIRLCCAGGAPLPDHVAEFFARNGVTLVQGYGLTESSPVISTGNLTHNRIGTVGPPIPGVEVQIADDGEILTRGPHVMLGYWNKPDETAATIRDGWLHTGDLGTLEDGYLRITGRKKELLVLNSGKNVAPAAIESRLTADPLIAQALVVGDGHNYLTALIVPDREMLARETIASSPAALQALFAGRIATRCQGLADWEQVRRFALVERSFSAEYDEITPSLKLRREVILSHFSREITAMYAAEPAGCNAPPPELAEPPSGGGV